MLVCLALEMLSDGRHVEVVGTTVTGTVTRVSAHRNSSPYSQTYLYQECFSAAASF